MATKVQNAVAWAVAIANDNSHGYDQLNRWSPDYDCSSFVISAYEQAGVPVMANGATYTGNMIKAFIATGFIVVTTSVNLATGEGLQAGDVLHTRGHTEMYIGNNQLVGAHIAENGDIYADTAGDQTGNEISVTGYYNYPWTTVLRYPVTSNENITKDSVIAGNMYLSLGDQKTNAKYICRYLLNEGWTLNAIAGMLGNMQTESTINPQIWQNLNEGNTAGGYGLCQWTPATNLIEWATASGLDYTDIDTQLQRILYEVANGGQYYATDEYPETFAEFTQSTATPEYLAMAFLNNYERPADRDQPNRAEQARFWFDYLGDIEGGPVITPPTLSKRRKSLPLFMLYLATKRKI